MSNNTIKPRLIRLIHIAKQQVGMSDNDYRALLANVSRGKTSSKDLTAEQLETVLRHMKAQGFVATVKTPDGRERYRNLPNQQKKIRSLWLELHEAGAVRKARCLLFAKSTAAKGGIKTPMPCAILLSG